MTEHSDPKWVEHYGSFSEEDWIKLEQDAEELYKENNFPQNDYGHDTSEGPMVPSLFVKFTKSLVRFNRMNGYTYLEYVNRWKECSCEPEDETVLEVKK